MDDCLQGNYEEAAAKQRKLLRWEFDHVKKLRDVGHLRGIFGKARGALTGFLEDSGVTRRPYYPVSEGMQEKLERAFQEYWGQVVADEPLLARMKRNG